jgi:LAO/AO transport system kinase
MLAETGGLQARRARRARDEVEAIAVTALRERFGDLHGHADLDSLAQEVAAGRLDPYAAADRLLAAL